MDTAPKPYYFGGRNPHVSAVFTTALLGLASVRPTRATAANHPQLISACRRDELGVANSNVTPEVTDHVCPQHCCLSRCAPPVPASRGACRGVSRGAPSEGARGEQGALSASSWIEQF